MANFKAKMKKSKFNGKKIFLLKFLVGLNLFK